MKAVDKDLITTTLLFLMLQNKTAFFYRNTGTQY